MQRRVDRGMTLHPENPGTDMNTPKPYYEEPGIQIYCGDCRTILPSLPASHAIITDPVWPAARAVLFGQDDPKGMMDGMFSALRGLPRRLVVHLGCDSDPRFLLSVPEQLKFFRVCWLKIARCSYKGRLLMGSDVAYLFGDPPKSIPGKHVISGEVMDADSKGKQSDHPCPRKFKHVAWLLNLWTEPADTVLDPFMGSGTTLVAAKLHGRPSVGIEIEERYCEMAVNRLRQGVLIPV